MQSDVSAPSAHRNAVANRQAALSSLAQAPLKNVAMMCFMMWMSGSQLHLFSIMTTASGFYQPLSAILKSGEGGSVRRSLCLCGRAPGPAVACGCGEGVERTGRLSGKGSRASASPPGVTGPGVCRRVWSATVSEPGCAGDAPARITRPRRAVPAVFPPDPEGEVDTLIPRLIYCAINLAGLAFAIYRINLMGLIPTHLTDWAGTLTAPVVSHRAVAQLW